jgi:hypothetical protein
VIHPVLETDPGQQLLGASARRTGGYSRHAKRRHHVLPGVQARDEVECLEHDANPVAPVVRQRRPVETNDLDIAHRDTPGRGCEDARQARKQGRLPTAAGAQQDHQLPVDCLDVE